MRTIKKEKILFICYGNVSRSQMAEAFYNNFTKSHKVKSAGVDPQSPKRHPHPVREIVDLMLEEGIDVSSQTVKLVDEKMVKNSDKVVVMCKKETCPDFVLRHKNIVFWDIPDPFMQQQETIRKIRNTIKEKVISLINERRR